MNNSISYDNIFLSIFFYVSSFLSVFAISIINFLFNINLGYNYTLGFFTPQGVNITTIVMLLLAISGLLFACRGKKANEPKWAWVTLMIVGILWILFICSCFALIIIGAKICSGGGCS